MRIVSTAPSAPALENLAVLSTSAVDARGRNTVLTDSVSFRVGGPNHRITSTYVQGELRASRIRAYQQTPHERAAAAALADAIAGSGLLSQLQPSPGIGRPEPGFTRIYVNRRSRYLEFANGQAPASAQAVLDALAAYRAVAERGAA